jgi:DNA-binding beta-propeller fold protein YncE
MTYRQHTLSRGMATVAAAFAVFAADAGPLYQIDSAVTVKGQASPSWDYLAFDPASSLLYVSLRADGALVFDTKAKKVVRTLDDTKGANAFVLLPAVDRGFVINQDGSATVFELATHKTLKRVKFAEEADNGFYDPVTQQLLVTTGGAHEAVFLDPKSGEVLGRMRVDSSKLEGTAPDGKGNMFMALRDRNKVLRIDMKRREVTAEWPTPGCEQPNGVAFDAANKRVLVACRGASPVLAAMNADNGRVVSTVPIGRGSDVMVFDAEQRKIYTANGVDANLTVIDQVDADTYKVAEVPTTRPYARTMALDPRTKTVYLVAAEGTVDPNKKFGSDVATYYPNTYFKDTFTVLSLQRR